MFIYFTDVDQLFYDADGSGAGAANLIAAFSGDPNITADDIFINGAGGGSAKPSAPQAQTQAIDDFAFEAAMNEVMLIDDVGLMDMM